MAGMKRVVLGVCGSIAAYKACDLVRRLMEKNCHVDVAMSEEATKLVSSTTFAALTGHPVYANMWDDKAWQMAHIDLAKQAQVMVIAPATANVIAKLAYGFADDCVTTVALATQAPLVVAPAMNEGMYQHAAVQENLSVLKKRGAVIVSPVKGNLACGDVGVGHLADIDAIVQAVLKAK